MLSVKCAGGTTSRRPLHPRALGRMKPYAVQSLLWLVARQARLPDGSVRSPDAAVVILDRSRATGCGDAVAGKGAPRDRGTLGGLRDGLPETLHDLVDCLD